MLDFENAFGSNNELEPDAQLPVVRMDAGNKRKLSGSKDFKYEIKFNDAHWKFIPAKDMSPMADLALAHKEHEIYAMLIAETSKLSMEDLRSAALVNLHKAADDVKVRKSALRVVNGKEMLVMMVDCRIDEHQITYYNYYYTGDWGILQYIVFSDQTTMKEQQAEVEALLSGLMVD
jgi:hypothetical protein